MTPEKYGRRGGGRSLDYLARAYREMLARDQAMLDLLAGAAVALLAAQHPNDDKRPG